MLAVLKTEVTHSQGFVHDHSRGNIQCRRLTFMPLACPNYAFLFKETQCSIKTNPCDVQTSQLGLCNIH